MLKKTHYDKRYFVKSNLNCQKSIFGLENFFYRLARQLVLSPCEIVLWPYVQKLRKDSRRDCKRSCASLTTPYFFSRLKYFFFSDPLAYWYIALTLFIMIKTMIWQLLGIVSTKRAHNFAQYGNTILSKANFRRSAIFMGVGGRLQ